MDKKVGIIVGAVAVFLAIIIAVVVVVTSGTQEAPNQDLKALAGQNLPEATTGSFREYYKKMANDDDTKDYFKKKYEKIINSTHFKNFLDGTESFMDLTDTKVEEVLSTSGLEISIKEIYEEILKFLKNFYENVKIIKEHNEEFIKNGASSIDSNDPEKKPGKTYVLGLNQYSDLSYDDFKAEVLMSARDDKPSSIEKNANETAELKAVTLGAANEHFSWKGKYVTKVKNQGQCGSCWIFSAAGALEGAICKAGKKQCSSWAGLSEQQFLNCERHQGSPCQGGWPYKMMEEARTKGMCIDHTTYYGRQYSCTSKTDQYCQNKVKIYGSTGYEGSGTIDNLKRTIRAYGPVSITYPSNNRDFQSYRAGTIHYSRTTQKDHAMTATGYGTDSYGYPYIEVKNSWGTGWGDRGYVRVSAYQGYTGGIENGAVYAIAT